MSAQREQQALASALVELLASSPLAIARLRELVEIAPALAQPSEAPVYTAASLAAVLDVSARVIRGAIARGELDAAKRGGRWIISAEAVARWAEAGSAPAPGTSRRRRTNGRASLATVMALLDTGANSGGSRL